LGRIFYRKNLRILCDSIALSILYKFIYFTINFREKDFFNTLRLRIILFYIFYQYRGPPPNAHLHPTHTLSKIQPPHSKIDNVSHNARIELAIADLESQTQPNFSATARKHNIQRTTLARRFKGESIFK
jgi:hypothetical protein